jgi:uncharacterized protein (DUF1330 family)
MSADEVFSCGNHGKVLPTRRIEDREWPIGPITVKARDLYFDFAQSTRRYISEGTDMPAYLIVQVKIRDPEIYKQYTARSPEIIAKHGGKILARGGATEILEGDDTRRRVVIVEFPSMGAARQFYSSPEYQQAKEIRAPIADAEFVVVQGIE